jgi:hypothetical protein
MIPSRRRSRSPLRTPHRTVESAAEGATRLRDAAREHLPPPGPMGSLVASALTAAAGKAVHRWARSRAPSWRRLLRGAAAGVGAAGLVFALRRVLDDPSDLELADELLAGAGKGVVYAAILDPVLPGPPLVRGAITGTMEYLTVPWGGVLSRLQDLSPARKLPLVGALLETGDAEDDPYLAFLMYGVALAILHGEGDPV